MASTSTGAAKSDLLLHDGDFVAMQENPNAIPEGETPHAVSMFAFDSLLDVCKPGDRITVTGIYKAVPMRTSPRLRQLKVQYTQNLI